MPGSDRTIEGCRAPVAFIDVGACVEFCRDRRNIALLGGIVDGVGMRYNRNVYKHGQHEEQNQTHSAPPV